MRNNKGLSELPEFTDSMSNEQKIKTCKMVFDCLNDTAHPVRINLEKIKEEIAEIRIIEGEKRTQLNQELR